MLTTDVLAARGIRPKSPCVRQNDVSHSEHADGPAGRRIRIMPAHRFPIGQLVRLKSRAGLSPKAAHTYRVEALLPLRDNLPQYRLRNDEADQERVACEDNLYVIERVADPDNAIPD